MTLQVEKLHVPPKFGTLFAKYRPATSGYLALGYVDTSSAV